MAATYNSIYGTLGSLFGGALGGLLGPGYSNPANAAMPYLNQIAPTAQANYNPYIQTGQNAMNQLYGQYSNLGTPQGAINTMNQFSNAYQPSAYNQYQTQNIDENNAQIAAASGQAGSPSEQVAVADQVNGITSADENQWLAMTMGLYNQGLQGLGGLNQEGFQANNYMTDDQIKALMAQSGLSYAGQANQNKYNAQQNDMWSSLLGTAGSLAGFL